MLQREAHHPATRHEEQLIGDEKDSIGACAFRGPEGGFEIVRRPDLDAVGLDPKGAYGAGRVLSGRGETWVGRIVQHSNALDPRDRLLQDLQPLDVEFGRDHRQPRDVSTGPR